MIIIIAYVASQGTFWRKLIYVGSMIFLHFDFYYSN